MPNLLQTTLMLVVFAVSLPLSAAVEVYEFSSPQKRERYQQLTEVLRCPKCQNQNLAGSNSPIASDLRREIHRLLEEGKTNAQIKSFMVSRYGDYVLYRPPLQTNTLLLWWGPPAILGVGVLVLLLLVWRRHRVLREGDLEELSSEDQARLNELLAQEQRSAALGNPSNPDPFSSSSHPESSNPDSKHEKS